MLYIRKNKKIYRGIKFTGMQEICKIPGECSIVTDQDYYFIPLVHAVITGYLSAFKIADLIFQWGLFYFF